MSTKSYKLTYFNVTALGEPIRMLFNYGGIAFEDDRFEQEQWPEIKSSTPFGQAPVLTIDGKKINQSIAIARYVAKLVKLAGKDDFHSLEIDSMVDNVNDVRAKIADYWYQTDEKVKEAKKGPLMKEILPNLLTKLDAVAKENNGYFVHGELSWADVYFTGILDYLNFMLDMDMVEKYPNLALVKKNVLAVPNIQKYMETRPKTVF